MVVSYIPLSKETPFDKLYVLYQKIIQNTFLPNRLQPGFTQEFDTDRLYYVLRSFINTDDSDEKFLLQNDLEGDFVSNVQVKQIYKRIFGEKVTYFKKLCEVSPFYGLFFSSQPYICLIRV